MVIKVLLIHKFFAFDDGKERLCDEREVISITVPRLDTNRAHFEARELAAQAASARGMSGFRVRPAIHGEGVSIVVEE